MDRLNTIRLSREEELNRTLAEANDEEILQKRRRPFIPRVIFCGVKVLILLKIKEPKIFGHV